MHGREPKFAIDNVALHNLQSSTHVNDYAYLLAEALAATKEIVLTNITKAQEAQKRLYDKRTRAKVFKIGQLVLLKRPKNRKLDPDFKGPFVVLQVEDLRPNTILLGHPDDPVKQILASLHRVKPYFISDLRKNST